MGENSLGMDLNPSRLTLNSGCARDRTYMMSGWICDASSGRIRRSTMVSLSTVARTKRLRCNNKCNLKSY